ncbi:hypothetical protein ACEQ8H_003629 [Pleosporales sp. CAS-2024a]
MDVPDLSLRNTLSPQLLLKDSPRPLLLKDSPNTSTCRMCKYTIYNLDCGHAAEDHVDSKDCPYFQKTQVACDRDNPANRSRVSIKSEHRHGLCNKCRQQQREIEAMARDILRAKEQDQAEAKAKAEALKKHEERIFNESVQEYERKQREQEQEDKDMEYMLQKSREEAEAAEAAEAARLAQEQADLARVLKRSEKKKTPVQLPSPPATPLRTPRPRPAEKPAAPVDFSKPAGQQGVEYGGYLIGGRKAPVHVSQEEKAAKFKMSSPTTPMSPAAPVARLGAAIQPGSPSPRQMPGIPATPGGDLRSGLRRTGGPRKSLPAQVEIDDGAELRAHLARRRTLEPRTSVEDIIATYSITPSESASNRASRASSPTGSNVSRTSRASAARNDSVYGEIDLSHRSIDEQRKKGWRKD